MEGKHKVSNIIKKPKIITQTDLPNAKVNVTIQNPNDNWIIKNCIVGGREDNKKDLGSYLKGANVHQSTNNLKNRYN